MSELTSLAQAGRHRFRDATDWFVMTSHEGFTTTKVGASSERVVDLWHALSAYLDPAVDVRLHDVRTARTWTGSLLALPDVRETMGRLRLPLSAYGGVELTVGTGNDQLSLTPEMLLVIYARTDRWGFLLDGLGLVEREVPPRPTWIPSRSTLRPESQLEQALQTAAERLGLAEVTV
ncbi:hypothetical protein [Gemmatimonas phototrophica]|uniref:Uncharacterized protein n=1 Tax=Gemmatimonas phototrophica TaxID=1379270 RepID=A0A143BKE3_9BACT|nr:hypothetical protein [Gemmatimonas phototrophica]AMW05055.1 hypothetical protein GEMMAAP_09925 [Gemmatimonas phototrophica]